MWSYAVPCLMAVYSAMVLLCLLFGEGIEIYAIISTIRDMTHSTSAQGIPPRASPRRA
jgi:hypothetical protein